MSKTKQEWWASGVRFECQGSGQCCVSHGEFGYVYMTAIDRRRMAAVLKIPTRQFTREYCVKKDGWFILRDFDKDCRFLKDKRCTVYEGRPSQCRTWPFWPENMNSKTWHKEIASFCPGIGKGPVRSPQEIKQALKQK